VTAADLQRMAQATSWDDKARTARVVLSTDANVGDGVVLLHTRQAIQWPERPVPVVLDHRREVASVIGAVSDLALEPLNGGTALVGRLQIDGPAADQALPLLRTGAARWSIGARVLRSVREVGTELVKATSWAIGHLSLVVEPQDLAAITRSTQPQPPTMTQTTSTTAPAIEAPETDDEPQFSRAELKRQRDIVRTVSEAKLDPELAEELIRSGLPLKEATREIVRALRIKSDGGDRFAPDAPLIRAGYQWAQPVAPAGAEGEPADPLARALHRALRGQSLDRSLIDELKVAGYAGRSGEELARSAFSTGKRNQLLRGFHSTSDAKDLLLESGDRLLQERHQEAPRGILELARPRTLSDFREVSTIDAGLVSGAIQLNEGAEIKYGSLNSEAGKYKPSRYGLGLSFTFEALSNDDLGGIAAVLNEVSQTMLEAEATRLGELLHGPGALGGVCPDGKALFHADHANKLASPGTLSTQGVGDMVELLRRQTSVGGRKIWLQPGYILVGPDLETTALQLFSETWSATAPDDTNPWKNLRLIVDPTVAEGFFYLAASGSRKPFELGRVDGMPTMKQEEDFNTSGMKMKVEHAFGAACIDHRVIVRNK
jgi:hypothetical protein